MRFFQFTKSKDLTENHISNSPKLPYVPTEIIQQIISHVDDAQSLRNISKCAKAFNEIAKQRISQDVLTINSAEKLYDLLNREGNGEDIDSLKQYKHLELVFDLKWLRFPCLVETIIFVIPSFLPLSGLDSITLITTGLNFFIEDSILSTSLKPKNRRVITLHMVLDKILRLLVDGSGPKSLKWIDGNSTAMRKYNKIRADGWKTCKFPQTPPIFHNWSACQSWHLPYLFRPTWKISDYGITNDKNTPLLHISIPAAGLHKYLKGWTMEYLVSDILGRSNGKNTTFEIRGKPSSVKEGYIQEFNKLLKERDLIGVIQVVWVDDKKSYGTPQLHAI